MHNFTALFVAAAVLAAALPRVAAAEATSSPAPHTPPHQETRSLPVRDLIGETVVDETGERLGEVTRVLWANGDTYFLAVSHGGFLGIGTKTAALAVPRMQLENGDTLVMPGMTKGEFDSLTDIMEGRLPTAPSNAMVPIPVD